MALIFAGTAAGAAITFVPEAPVTGPVVHLGDVADLSAVPASLRERAAALELVRLVRDQRRVVLDRADLASRARSLLPALAPLLAMDHGPVVVLRHVGAAPLPQVSGANDLGIAKGETVQLTVRSGPVTVQRSARALQAGQAGGQVFVMTEERAVLAAVCCGGQ